MPSVIQLNSRNQIHQFRNLWSVSERERMDCSRRATVWTVAAVDCDIPPAGIRLAFESIEAPFVVATIRRECTGASIDQQAWSRIGDGLSTRSSVVYGLDCSAM